jgi:hypothetical protein
LLLYLLGGCTLSSSTLAKWGDNGIISWRATPTVIFTGIHQTRFPSLLPPVSFLYSSLTLLSPGAEF